MYDRNRNEPEECRLQQDTANKADFLTVHGLWPGLPKSIAARGVDERRWMRYGCATRPVPNMPEVKANRKCRAAETGLSLEMANKLNNVMPGSGGTSCPGTLRICQTWRLLRLRSRQLLWRHGATKR